MAIPQDQLAPNEFALYFQTNDRVLAAHFATLILLIERLARRSEHFGRGAILRISRLQSGSPVYAVLEVAALVGGTVSGIVAVGQMAGFVRQLVAELKSSDLLGQTLGGLMRDSSVAELTVRTRELTLQVHRHEVLPLPPGLAGAYRSVGTTLYDGTLLALSKLTQVIADPAQSSPPPIDLPSTTGFFFKTPSGRITFLEDAGFKHSARIYPLHSSDHLAGSYLDRRIRIYFRETPPPPDPRDKFVDRFSHYAVIEAVEFLEGSGD